MSAGFSVYRRVRVEMLAQKRSLWLWGLSCRLKKQKQEPWQILARGQGSQESSGLHLYIILELPDLPEARQNITFIIVL